MHTNYLEIVSGDYLTKSPKFANLKCISLKTGIMKGAGLNLYVARRITEKIKIDDLNNNEDFNRKIQKQYIDEKSGIRVQVYYVWLKDITRPECDNKILDIRFIRRI